MFRTTNQTAITIQTIAYGLNCGASTFEWLLSHLCSVSIFVTYKPQSRLVIEHGDANSTMGYLSDCDNCASASHLV